MLCPVCEEKNLVSLQTASGVISRCPECAQLFVGWNLLSRYSEDPARFLATLTEAQTFLIPTGRACPACQKWLQQGRVPGSGAIVTLCVPCQSLWAEPWQLSDLNPVVARALQKQLENPKVSVIPPAAKPLPKVEPPPKVVESPRIIEAKPGRAPILKPPPIEDPEPIFIPRPIPTPPPISAPAPVIKPPTPVPPPISTPTPAPIPAPMPAAVRLPPAVTTPAPTPATLPNTPDFRDLMIEPSQAARQGSWISGLLRSFAGALNIWADKVGTSDKQTLPKPIPAQKPAAKPIEPPKPAQPPKPLEPAKPAPVPESKPKPMPAPKPAKSPFWKPILTAMRDAWNPPAFRTAQPRKAAPTPTVVAPPVAVAPPVVVAAPTLAPKIPVDARKRGGWPAAWIMWGPRVLPWLVYFWIGFNEEDWGYAFIWALLFWSVGRIFRMRWMYPKTFKETTVSELSHLPQSSTARGIGVMLKGRLDPESPAVLNFKDSTGAIRLNRLSPVDLIPRVLGLTNLSQYPKDEFLIRGWYRPGKNPFIEVAQAGQDKETRKSLANGFRWFFAAGTLALSLLLLLTEF